MQEKASPQTEQHLNLLNNNNNTPTDTRLQWESEEKLIAISARVISTQKLSTLGKNVQECKIT